jgi:23S rRNA pseudouridine1911/1915/1917 synthase
LHPSQILYEDNHLLIVNKPAEWIVQGASTDQRSLLESSRMYIKQKYDKPGNVYLGVVSRLDGPVTGAVPFARTSKAAARLSEQFREHTPTKVYWAIVEGTPSPIAGSLEHYLSRHPEENVTRVSTQNDRHAAHAILEYRTLAVHQGLSLLEVRLITGRKHQIRCQLAAIGCPIVGDHLYGSGTPFPQGIGLHCHQLIVEHPTLKTPVSVVADTPIYWPGWAKPKPTDTTANFELQPP